MTNDAVVSDTIEFLEIERKVVAPAAVNDVDKVEESHALRSENEEKTEEVSSTAKDSLRADINPDKNDAAADVEASIDSSAASLDSSAPSVMYSCPFCQKSYDKGQSLQKHTRTRHNKTVVYCTLCAAVFRFVTSDLM